jgi:hypothetical protein
MTQVPTTSPPPTESDDGVADRARAVTTESKQQLGEVADVARRQAQDLFEDARREVRQQTESQAQRVSGAMRDVSRQLRGLADGNPDDGPVRTLVRTAADRIDDVTGRFERDGVQGSLASVRDMARRRPFVFLAGAMTAGLVVGRVLRNADTRRLAQDATGTATGSSANAAWHDGGGSGADRAAEPPARLGGTPPSAAPQDIEDMMGRPVGVTSASPAASPAPGGAGPTSSHP